MGIFLGLWAVLFGTFPSIAKSSAFEPLFAIWVFLMVFSMAGQFVLMPAACTRIFGPGNSATTYGLLYLTTVSIPSMLSCICLLLSLLP